MLTRKKIKKIVVRKDSPKQEGKCKCVCVGNLMLTVVFKGGIICFVADKTGCHFKYTRGRI